MRSGRVCERPHFKLYEKEEEKMNECFLQVKRISDIEFKFILYEIHKSVALFKGWVSETCIVQLLAYDTLADYLYSHKPTHLWIRGELRENAQVVIKELDVQTKTNTKGGQKYGQGK